MARYVARRDVLELLDDRYQQLLAARATARNQSGGAAAASPAPPASSPANQLMGPAAADKRNYPLRADFQRVQTLSPDLAQLHFAARQFIWLDTNADAQAAASRFPHFDSDVVQIRPGIRLHQRLANWRVGFGGRELRACALQPNQHAVFVAIESTDDQDHPVTYYGQLVLCFAATYLGQTRELCYIRWLHTARAVAGEQRRVLTAAESRGPFETYRWAIYPRGREGHPQRGGPWYGVVHTSKIMYRVHMVRSMHDSELFRLNTDVWLRHL